MKKIVLFFFLFIFFNSSINASECILQSTACTDGVYFEYYEDKDKVETIQSIQNRNNFIPLNKSVGSHFFSTSAFWYKIKVNNPQTYVEKQLLLMNVSWLDSVDFYIFSPSRKLDRYQQGNVQAFEARSLDIANINVVHAFEPGISEVYMRVLTRDPIIVSLSIQPIELFYKKYSQEVAIVGIFFGIIMAMYIYNSILYISSRKSIYGYYVLYLTFFILMLIAYNGYLYQYIWPNSPNLNSVTIPILMYAFIVTGVIFGRNFLDMKTSYPDIYQISEYFIYSVVISAVILYLLGGYHYLVMGSILSTLVFSFFMFYMGLVSWLNSNHWARYFLMGSTAGLLGTFITASSVISLIPFSTLSYRAIDIGVVIDAMLLSLALAERMRIVQEEKILAEKKAKENANISTQVKDEFISKMSHELRTPLNSIMGFIPLVAKEVNDVKTLSYISTMYNSSQSLLHIIDELLNLSDYQKGKMKLNEAPFYPMDKFLTCIKLFEGAAQDKSIVYISQINSKMPDKLFGDSDKILQILYNFISNAIKFTPDEGHVHIIVSYNDATEQLTLSVKDSGIGIKQADQDSIFEVFTQSDNSTTRRFGGTGIGLTLCKEFALMMNANIILESELNQGSTFSLHVPLQVPKEVSANQELIQQKYQGHILIVEDNKTTQMFLGAVLDDYTITYKIANDGLEAVEMYKNESFDLVIMDENMPNLNGMGATKIIRSFEESKSLTSTPIIGFSANVKESDKEAFLLSGMDDFIEKPIDYSELERVLDTYLY